MKKRLKSLLALCMAGIMMFAMTTGIASADETQTTSKIYMYNYIDSVKAYYPGDIIRPSMDKEFTSESGEVGTDFFVVKYYEINKLDDAYKTELSDNVVVKGFMTDKEFGQLDGVYRYWKDVHNYAVLCNYDKATKEWSVVEDEETIETMGNVMSKHSFTEYTRDPEMPGLNHELLDYDEKYKTKDFDKTVGDAFYSFAYGVAGDEKYSSRALELPSVDKLFGEDYEYGYHYNLNKIRQNPWRGDDDKPLTYNASNSPSGIGPVNATAEENLIDIIYGKQEQTEETRTEETQTKQGNEPLSTYSYSVIKDALLIEPVANKYTVNFDANGGSGDMGLTAVKGKPNTTGELTYDKNSKLPENKFTREGYNFNGWKIEQCTYQEFNGSGASITIDTSNEPYKKLYIDEDHYIPTRNNETVTLQAQWVKDGEYTVNYDTNGGSAVQGKTNVSWNDKNLNDVTPTKTGYTFKGWKCGDAEVTADTTYGELAKDYTVKTVTLTAQWEKAAAPATGDDMNTTLPIALLILSIIGIAGAGLYRRNHVK